jgi:hypothetical protein
MYAFTGLCHLSHTDPPRMTSNVGAPKAVSPRLTWQLLWASRRRSLSIFEVLSLLVRI